MQKESGVVSRLGQTSSYIHNLEINTEGIIVPQVLITGIQGMDPDSVIKKEYFDSQISTVEGVEGPRGPKGDPGPIGPAGLTWKGTWDSTTEYAKDDAVGYQGASYYASDTCTGVTPTDSPWALLANIGATGPEGPQGQKGRDGVFDINDLDNDELRILYTKLKEFEPQRHWTYSGTVGYSSPDNVYEFPIADSGLVMNFTRVNANYNRVGLSLSKDGSPLTKYDVKHTLQHAGGGIVQSWYRSEVQFESPSTITQIDGDVYGQSMELHMGSYFNHTTKTWYQLFMTIAGFNTTSSNHIVRCEVTKLGHMIH
ncbi:hypothetical protein E4630_12065 [Aeromonas hydrophila]|uniref:hypothetical protein n=1 Tax=Aeromonas hydrophila TaxID=644 RepID=UPI00107ED062|nr:hypothetical protein [Aeromonas hydrophila]QBX71536.1 hypothetical protein E4625_12285 [Aeromonas hydrophila]QBX76236.1 hypothetical protein E4630_12065 [Aeromonas hydrophila]